MNEALKKSLAQANSEYMGANSACSDLLYIDLYNILFADFQGRMLEYLKNN